MSGRMKVLWIIIGCLFALGLVLAGTGFALGATGRAWYDSNGLHFGNLNNRTIELAEDNTEPFEDINISLIEADVEIIVANNYGYEFTYTGTNEPEITVRNGTLTVKEHTENWHINIFGFWNFFDTSATLKVYVPRNATLDNVSLETASGSTMLNGNNVSIRELSCQTASGDIRLYDLSLEKLRLDVASGDVNLNNVSATSATINLMSGWLTYRGAELETLEMNLASGDVTLEGEITRLLQLHMTSGDANILLVGDKDDYSFDIKKISGEVRIDGQRVDGGFGGPGLNHSSSGTGQGAHIEIDITSGSVNINFK